MRCILNKHLAGLESMFKAVPLSDLILPCWQVSFQTYQHCSSGYGHAAKSLGTQLGFRFEIWQIVILGLPKEGSH